MKALHIYNSFTKEKEEFKSINPDKVGMYVCGPTVYGHPHLGHARSAITFDIVFRYLSYLGYKVRYVRNITDVGHLEDEVAGTGEDKIAKKARLEQLEPMEVAQTYTNSYHSAMDQLQVLRPSIEPLATGHIPEQIKAIENAIEAGFAYEKNGSVYFNLEKFAQEKEYGGLSGKVLEDLQVGSRDTEGLDEKDHPHDFALWKKADPKHIMKWESPWGLGFPGWHIECTAMSYKYLGFPFDIHGGGMDLQFPHHEADEVAGTGEDKIAKKARLEQLEPMEVAQTYTNSYHSAMDQLQVLRPSIEPLATGHIPEQIKAIENAIEAGFAYEKNGSVYFNLEKFAQEKEYGGLSGKVLEDLQVGSRDTEGLDEKDHPHDFALWKKADPKHIMKWESPWGLGFPGWHIECTAMSYKYLGFPFDIHGGGMDLQFPHHEAEIAQGQACFHEAPANYWMHNNMLTINGQKMAKSKGNFINLEEMLTGSHDLLEQAYTPMTIRFFMLQANYRSTVDFSNEALQAAEKGFQKLMKSIKSLKKLSLQKTKNLDESLNESVHKLMSQFEDEMNDDFNTAKAIAVLFELSSYIFQFDNKQLAWNSLSKETQENLIEKYPVYIEEVLGLKAEEEGSGDRLDALVKLFIDQRKDARVAKDFALSDKIRDDLAALGIVLKDGKEGTSYELE